MEWEGQDWTGHWTREEGRQGSLIIQILFFFYFLQMSQSSHEASSESSPSPDVVQAGRGRPVPEVGATSAEEEGRTAGVEETQRPAQPSLTDMEQGEKEDVDCAPENFACGIQGVGEKLSDVQWGVVLD